MKKLLFLILFPIIACSQSARYGIIDPLSPSDTLWVRVIFLSEDGVASYGFLSSFGNRVVIDNNLSVGITNASAQTFFSVLNADSLFMLAQSGQNILGSSAVWYLQTQGVNNVTLSTNGNVRMSYDLRVDGSLTGSSLMRGLASFTGTDREDTVAISGASVNDFYTITIKNTVNPSAADRISIEPTSTGFIVHRALGGTADLAYFWMRQK